MNILERLETKLTANQQEKIKEVMEPLKKALKEIYDKDPELAKDTEESFEHRSQLLSETDRGMCLLAVGKIDTVLMEILQKKLLGTKSLKRDLFGSNGPLGTLSSRLKLSYSLGILSQSHYREADAIRQIRNKFAHSDKPINFDSLEIVELSNNLKSIKVQDSEKSNRDKFISAHIFLFGRLQRIKRIANPYTTEDIELESGAFDSIGLITKVLPKLLTEHEAENIEE